jgi:hypothetical protein
MEEKLLHYSNLLNARVHNEMNNTHIILETVTNHDHFMWWNVPSGANVKQWSWIWLIGTKFSAQCRSKRHLQRHPIHTVIEYGHNLIIWKKFTALLSNLLDRYEHHR